MTQALLRWILRSQAVFYVDEDAYKWYSRLVWIQFVIGFISADPLALDS
jgi:hypothetical protein